MPQETRSDGHMRLIRWEHLMRSGGNIRVGLLTMHWDAITGNQDDDNGPFCFPLVMMTHDDIRTTS